MLRHHGRFLVDPKAFLTLVELAIANMYEVEAIGELLEQKGDWVQIDTYL